MDRVAFYPRQIGGRRSYRQEQLILLTGDIAHHQRNGGIGQVDDYINLLDIKPRRRDIHSDVRFVLHIAANDFDLHSFRCRTEVLDREPWLPLMIQVR